MQPQPFGVKKFASGLARTIDRNGGNGEAGEGDIASCELPDVFLAAAVNACFSECNRRLIALCRTLRRNAAAIARCWADNRGVFPRVSK